MKRLLTSLVVLAAVICGSCIHSAAADKAPAIRIVLEHQNNEAVSWLPALDNWGSTEPHTDSFLDGTISHSYKTVATAAGHLSVKAHYILTQNGVKTVVDKQLRVFEKKPEPGQWTQLSKGWNAYAYLAEYTQ